MKKDGKSVFRKLTESGFIVDWREPDIIRVAPVPFYNTYHEVWEFSKKLKSLV
jgi:kynureninase